MTESVDVTFALVVVVLGVFSFGVTSWLMPRIIHQATNFGILDTPDSRKRHSIPVPRLGGLGIYPVFLFCSLVALGYANNYRVLAFTSVGPVYFTKFLLGLFMGVTGSFLIGVADDFFQLRVRYKLASEVAVGVLALCFLPTPTTFLGVGMSPIIMQGFYLFFLILIQNSVNLLDGIDGITSTLVALFLAVVSVMMSAVGDFVWLLVTVPMIGALLGFARYNWNPAKIFLGDGGSLSLGFMVAYLSLAAALVQTSADQFEFYPRVSFLLSAIWLTDTLLAIGRRYACKHPSFKIMRRRSLRKWAILFQRALGHIVVPDANHLHHKFLRWGFSVPHSVFLISIFALSAFVLAVPVRLLFEPNFQLRGWNQILPLIFVASMGMIAFAFAYLFYFKSAWLDERSASRLVPLAVIRRQRILAEVARASQTLDTDAAHVQGEKKAISPGQRS